MTAINIIKQTNAVHMITDGASWVFDGGFGPACCKAWPISHLRAVVSARGPRLAPLLMADFLNTAGRTYDEMKANAVTMVRELLEVYASTFSGPFGDNAEFVIAGWSEANGPDAFVLSRDPAGIWILQDTGPLALAPGDAEIQQAVAGALAARQVYCADEMDPAVDGLGIVHIQRDACLEAEGLKDGMRTVGAFVQLTTVKADGISTRVLHTWPEEWGEAQVPPAQAAA